jgi:hypothetical protein
MENFRAGKERPEPVGIRPGTTSAILGQIREVQWPWHGHRRTEQQGTRESILDGSPAQILL